MLTAAGDRRLARTLLIATSTVMPVMCVASVSVDLHRWGTTDQTGLDSRPDRERLARGRLVGPRRVAHI